MEELKFEKLSHVEVVEEPSEESHVLIVEGGEVKKAPKTAVGGSGKRELMYEFNFTVADDVSKINHNVDDDLSWLAEPSEEYGWEIEEETYYCTTDDSEERVVHEDKVIIAKIEDKMYGSGYIKNVPFEGSSMLGVYTYSPGWYETDWDNKTYAYGWFSNRIHVDADYNNTLVEKGGNIYWLNDNGNPLKSLRIYKVTK